MNWNSDVKLVVLIH